MLYCKLVITYSIIRARAYFCNKIMWLTAFSEIWRKIIDIGKIINTLSILNTRVLGILIATVNYFISHLIDHRSNKINPRLLLLLVSATQRQ